MNKNREVLKLTEDQFRDIICEDSEEYDLIEEEQTYYDTEKGACDYDIIVQRRSDWKFFSASYTKWPAGGRTTNNILTEVFPETVVTTTTVYK